MKMNPVVHFVMPAEDRKRMADFYTNVFGWKTQMLGPEMGSYVLATTTDSDEKGPKMPGTINGGFFLKSDDKPAQYPSVVILVEDIKEHMKKVEKAGRKVLGRAVGYTQRRAVRIVYRHGRQQGKHAPVPSLDGGAKEAVNLTITDVKQQQTRAIPNSASLDAPSTNKKSSSQRFDTLA